MTTTVGDSTNQDPLLVFLNIPLLSFKHVLISAFADQEFLPFDEMLLCTVDNFLETGDEIY